jgi:FimV-like protein
MIATIFLRRVTLRKTLLLLFFGLPVFCWAANLEPVIVLTPAKPQLHTNHQQPPAPKLKIIILQQPTSSLVELPLPQRVSQLALTKTEAVLSHNMQLLQIQQQLLATQEDLKGYKREMNDRFVTIEQQNLATQADILNIHQSLAGITQQVMMVGTKVASIASVASIPSGGNSAPTAAINYLPKNKFTWWIIFGALFLIVLLWMPSSKREAARRKEPMVSNTDADLKDEYDFMGSQEAIPAKLNLARAYIDMEDFFSARQVLQEIITRGNIKEQLQAKQMLSVCELH